MGPIDRLLAESEAREATNDLSGAISACRAAAAIDPDRADAWLRLYHLYLDAYEAGRGRTPTYRSEALTALESAGRSRTDDAPLRALVVAELAKHGRTPPELEEEAREEPTVGEPELRVLRGTWTLGMRPGPRAAEQPPEPAPGVAWQESERPNPAVPPASSPERRLERCLTPGVHTIEVEAPET